MPATLDVLTGPSVPAPLGFATYTGHAGVKDVGPDVSVLSVDPSHRANAAAGVFTRSLFAGPSVSLSRRHLASGKARAIVTVSGNANVATGAQGQRDAAELAELAARVVGCAPNEVVVCSTGVIGRLYPMGRLREHFARARMPDEADFAAVARAIMTTDTRPKLASARAGAVTVTGVAKGSGMIEPNMATLLAYVAADASVGPEELDAMWRRVVGQTFNCLSIDTDTSTSDSAVVLASGAAGPVAPAELEAALLAVCHSLTLQLAADGEGATKLVQVDVDEARDADQARRVAKTVVSSPLVKCAVHGADPNWGRVVMAIGKCWQDTDIVPEAVRVSFAGFEVYPRRLDGTDLEKLAALMREPVVEIGIRLGTGSARATAWGCDLSAGYVRVNADYTT
jgi:glutamate N-acetyltransferase/amino-acid N-acetyltransferase